MSRWGWLALLFLGHWGVHRLFLLHEAYAEARLLWEHDAFVDDHICQNETLRANLGAHYQYVCHEAGLRVALRPIARAFKSVLERTHLCGDTPCVDGLEALLAALSRQWFVLAVAVASLTFFCRYRRQRGGDPFRRMIINHTHEGPPGLENGHGAVDHPPQLRLTRRILG